MRALRTTLSILALLCACDRTPVAPSSPATTAPTARVSAPPAATSPAPTVPARDPRRVACTVADTTVLGTPTLPDQAGNFARNVHGPAAMLRFGLTRGAQPDAWVPDVHWAAVPDGSPLHSPSTARGLTAAFATAENPEWVVPVATARFAVLVALSADGVLSAAFEALPDREPRRLFSPTPGRDRVVASTGVIAPRGPLVVTRFEGAGAAPSGQPSGGAQRAIFVQFDDAGAELSRRSVEGDVVATLVREGRVYAGVRDGAANRVRWSAAEGAPPAPEEIPADLSAAPACEANATPSAERLTLLDALEFGSATNGTRAMLSARMRREARGPWCLEGVSGPAASSLPAGSFTRSASGWTGAIFERGRRVDLRCP